MGFFDFFKQLFTSDDDDEELKAARERHGISAYQTPEEKKEEQETYDPWEDVRNARMNFLMGSWASRKFRVVGEDKVKKELEELERKRMEKELKGEK